MSLWCCQGDQASIIGGAIEFVKELEHILHSLKLQKERKDLGEGYLNQQDMLRDFTMSQDLTCEPNIECTTQSKFCEVDSNVEVKLIGRSAIIKVLAQKKAHQLLNVLPIVQGLHLKIMQMNITTIEDSVLYYLNVEVSSLSIFGKT